LSRSCLCARWLTRAVTDPALAVAPASVRALFLELVARATACGNGGVFRFLGSVPVSVSRLVTRPETEIETEIESLRALGLLDLDEDGCGLALVGAREASARIVAARANGLRGGRPRRGETVEQMRQRRQGAFMLPIAGGAPAKTHETENRTNPESSCATSTSPSLKEVKEVARAPAWVSLASELADLAGFDPARGYHDARHVQGWLEAGATPELLRRVISDVADRPGYAEKRIRTWRYFDRAVIEAIQGEAAPPLHKPGYGEALIAWTLGGEQGPKPTRMEFAA